jgi:hypothetical protein
MLCDRVPQHVTWLITWLVVPLVVDFFAYAVRPGASAHHAARRRLLHLRCASSCLGSRHVVRLVMRLIVDYSVCRDLVLRPHWLYFSHAVRCDYLSRGNTGSTSSTSRAVVTSYSGRIMSTIHLV